MDTQTAEQAGMKDRRHPLFWVADTIAVVLLLGVWFVTEREGVAQALAEGREPAVSLGFPAIIVIYVAYRLGRKVIKGSAYPARKPGEHRSFSITRKRDEREPGVFSGFFK